MIQTHDEKVRIRFYSPEYINKEKNMKRKLLLTIIAVIMAFVCSFGFIACTDDEEADLSAVNGTYHLCMVNIDDDGNIVGGEMMNMTATLKDGKFNEGATTYKLKGDAIIIRGVNPENPSEWIDLAYEKVADGIYLESVYVHQCLILEGVTPPFPVEQ